MEYSLSSNHKKYLSKNPLKRYLLKRFINKLVNIVDSTGYNNILDVGCGEGFVASELFNKIKNCEITGVDINEDSLKIARDRQKNILFIKGNIYNLDFEDKQFDVVICTEVLEHLEDPTKALMEIHRVCKKHLIISVPDEPYFSIGNFLSFSHLKTWGNPIDHINRWTFKDFINWTGSYLGQVKGYRIFPWTLIHYEK